MEELIGRSKSIQQVRHRVRSLAKTRNNVLVIGEPGVGKSVVAKNIHHQSVYSDKPFVYLSATATDELKLRSTVQTILTKRRFANPETSEHGNFPLPDGASLIIDKVEEMSEPGQQIVADLLSGLGEKPSGIRIMILVTMPCDELVSERKMTDRMAGILNGWESISIPPLRERREDIPDLVELFVERGAKELKLGEMIIDINAISILVRREWKKNVQELKTFVEHALMLSEDKETFTLPESLVDEQSELAAMLRRIDDGVAFALDQSMELIERRILERVLRKFSFNQSKAARFLNITEDTLRYRMKKLGIST